MADFYKIPIKDIKRETKDSVSIGFEIPSELKSKFDFVPGQYVNFKVNLNGEEIRRSYSICSSFNNPEIRVAVKAVKDGQFSVFANTDLKRGDVIELSAPEGRFTLPVKESHQKKYLAFAAGSGITPIMSMIRSVLEVEPNSKFDLVYGNKSKESTIFYSALEELKESYPNQLNVHYVLSEIIDAKCYAGRINKNLISELFQFTFKDINFDNIFLCGPEEMIDDVQSALIEVGVEKDKIKFELFTTAVKNVEDTIDANGASEVTFILDEEETKITVNGNENLLDAALLHNLDAPYSCQGGICSSCLARVEEGKAVMDSNKILDDDEIAEGLILTCQAHAVTPKVVVNYDNV